MALGTTRRQAFGLTDDEEDAIVSDVRRGVLSDIASDPDDVPVIDLGDDAEVLIEREAPAMSPESRPVDPFASQARGVALRSASLTSPVRRSPEPGISTAAPTTAPGLVDDEPIAAPGVELDPIGRPVNGQTPPPPPSTPDPDDEPVGGPAPVAEVRPTQPVEAVRPLRKRHGTTPDDLVALGRADDQDRRRRIGRGILGAAGTLLTLAAAGSGRIGLAGLGQAMVTGARGFPANRRETVQGRIDDRNERLRAEDAADLAFAQQRLSEERSAQEAAQAARRGALAERQIESEIELDQARIAQMQAEEAETEFERQAIAGNAEGMRAAIRARIAAVQHQATRRAWEERIGQEGSAIDQMTDLDSLRSVLDNVARTDIRRGGGGAGGSGGPRTVVDTDPMTGLTRSRRVGGSASAGTPRTAPAGSGERGAPAAEAAPPPDPELAALAQAYPGLTGPAVDIAIAEMRRRSLSIEDLATPEGHGVIRAAVNAYLAAPAATQAQMLREAGDVYAARTGGRTPMPSTVNPRIYERLAPSMSAVYQGWVQPFERARAALRDARNEGASEAAIRIALQGGNNDALARVATAQMMPSLRRLKTYAALMGELFGRERSGAAISESEWSNFRNLLGTQNIYLTGSNQFDQTMSDLATYGRTILDNRATPAGEFAGDYVTYFLRSLSHAARERRSRRRDGSR